MLANEDPDYAYDQWLFTDEPFVNELCLVLLVVIRHQLERELLGLLARVIVDAKEIDGGIIGSGCVLSGSSSGRGKAGRR